MTPKTPLGSATTWNIADDSLDKLEVLRGKIYGTNPGLTIDGILEESKSEHLKKSRDGEYVELPLIKFFDVCYEEFLWIFFKST